MHGPIAVVNTRCFARAAIAPGDAGQRHFQIKTAAKAADDVEKFLFAHQFPGVSCAAFARI